MVKIVQAVGDYFCDDADFGFKAVPVCRKYFYIMIGIVCFAPIYISLWRATPLYSLAQESSHLTLCYRLGLSFIHFSIALFSVIVSGFYFKHIIEKKAAIKLSDICTFSIIVIVAMGLFYYDLYQINTSLFVYENSPIVVKPTLTGRTYGDMLGTWQFLLFSGLHSLNTDYYKIKPMSSIICVAIFLQCLYSLCIVSLFVASFVNQISGNIKQK